MKQCLFKTKDHPSSFIFNAFTSSHIYLKLNIYNLEYIFTLQLAIPLFSPLYLYKIKKAVHAFLPFHDLSLSFSKHQNDSSKGAAK